MNRIVCQPMGGANFKSPKPPKAPRKGMRQVSAKKAAFRASEAGKAGADHMAQVARLQCAACFIMGRKQRSPTEVHHFKSGRYGSAREVDTKTMPLCHSHHNKLRTYPGDEDINGYHNGQETWEAQFGPDYTFEPWVKAQIAMLDDTIDF